MRGRAASAAALALTLSLVAGVASAQDLVSGRVATSSAGEAGQRRTQAVAGVAPMARLNTRIQNRINSRLSTRIDRNQDTSLDDTAGYDTAVRAVRQTDDGPR